MNFIPAIDLVGEPTPQGWHLAFVDGKLLLLAEAEAPQLQPLSGLAAAALRMDAQARHYLGRLEGLDCWALRLPEVPAGWQPVPLRQAMMAFPETLAGLAGRAAQVLEWDRTHRYCGACGTPTVHQAGERCVKCPACGMVAYPRISPAMMVLIKRGNEILLARHTHSPAPFFTALAGFLEAGESIEEAVHREVFEEVGLRVRDIRYHASQPWPFPHSLMIAFTAEYDSGEIRVDESEIAEARWFGPGDSIPRTPHGISIASHLISAHLPG